MNDNENANNTILQSLARLTDVCNHNQAEISRLVAIDTARRDEMGLIREEVVLLRDLCNVVTKSFNTNCKSNNEMFDSFYNFIRVNNDLHQRLLGVEADFRKSQRDLLASIKELNENLDIMRNILNLHTGGIRKMTESIQRMTSRLSLIESNNTEVDYSDQLPDHITTL